MLAAADRAFPSQAPADRLLRLAVWRVCATQEAATWAHQWIGEAAETFWRDLRSLGSGETLAEDALRSAERRYLQAASFCGGAADAIRGARFERELAFLAEKSRERGEAA